MKNHTVPVLMAAAIAVVICLGTVQGPDDLRAAQDSADDTSAAQRMAQQAAMCKKRFGPSAQVFTLEGQHTVCRPAVAVGVAGSGL